MYIYASIYAYIYVCACAHMLTHTCVCVFVWFKIVLILLGCLAQVPVSGGGEASKSSLTPEEIKLKAQELRYGIFYAVYFFSDGYCNCYMLSYITNAFLDTIFWFLAAS